MKFMLDVMDALTIGKGKILKNMLYSTRENEDPTRADLRLTLLFQDNTSLEFTIPGFNHLKGVDYVFETPHTLIYMAEPVTDGICED